MRLESSTHIEDLDVTVGRAASQEPAGLVECHLDSKVAGYLELLQTLHLVEGLSVQCEHADHEIP